MEKYKKVGLRAQSQQESHAYYDSRGVFFHCYDRLKIDVKTEPGESHSIERLNRFP